MTDDDTDGPEGVADYVRVGGLVIIGSVFVVFAAGAAYLVVWWIGNVVAGLAGLALHVPPPNPDGSYSLGIASDTPGIAALGVGSAVGTVVVFGIVGYVVVTAPGRLRAWYDHLTGGDLP